MHEFNHGIINPSDLDLKTNEGIVILTKDNNETPQKRDYLILQDLVYNTPCLYKDQPPKNCILHEFNHGIINPSDLDLKTNEGIVILTKDNNETPQKRNYLI